MNHPLSRIYCLLCCLFFAAGCEQPQPSNSADDVSLNGITLSDLQASGKTQTTEPQLAFSVLTYELDAASMDSLSKVYRLLSKWGIQYEDKTAFDANGFAVGLGMPQKGAEVVRALAEIGARRITQSQVATPAGSHEVLSATAVEPQTLWFPKSHRTLGGATLSGGQLGWIFSAEKDPNRDLVLTVQAQPAFWEQGMSDLRLLAGKVPFKFKTFDVGRFQIELRQGQFFVLGPNGAILTQQTLNQLLFADPRHDKGRLLVVIVEKVGN